MGGTQSNELEMNRVLPTQVIVDGQSPDAALHESRTVQSPHHVSLSLTKQAFPISLVHCSAKEFRVRLVLNLAEVSRVSFVYGGVDRLSLDGIGPGKEVCVYSSAIKSSQVMVVVSLPGKGTSLNLNIQMSADQATVKSQQASINGQLFDIENMFGITTEKKCVICMGSDVTVAVQPCRHACMCSSCATDLTANHIYRCPVCRSPANGILQLDVREERNNKFN